MYLGSIWYPILHFLNSEQKEKLYEDKKLLKLHLSWSCMVWVLADAAPRLVHLVTARKGSDFYSSFSHSPVKVSAMVNKPWLEEQCIVNNKQHHSDGKSHSHLLYI